MQWTLSRDLFEPVGLSVHAVELVGFFSTVAMRGLEEVLLLEPPWQPGEAVGPVAAWLKTHPSLSLPFRGLLDRGPRLSAGRARMRGQESCDQPVFWHLAPSSPIRVMAQNPSDWPARMLTLPDALDLLCEPVQLVLENRRHDFVFLRHLAGPTDGDRLQALHEAPGRMVVHGGGGGEIRAWLNEFQGTSEDLSPAQWRRLLRSWVMFDRDVGEDALEPSRAALQQLELLGKLRQKRGDVLCWVCLERREIESYTPDIGLIELSSGPVQQNFAREVIRWRQEPNRERWAWSLDLKKGLRGDLSSSLTKEQRDEAKKQGFDLSGNLLKSPFNTLSPQEVTVLQDGFTDKRINTGLSQVPPPPWTRELPREYERGPASQAPREALIQSLLDRY